VGRTCLIIISPEKMRGSLEPRVISVSPAVSRATEAQARAHASKDVCGDVQQEHDIYAAWRAREERLPGSGMIYKPSPGWQSGDKENTPEATAEPVTIKSTIKRRFHTFKRRTHEPLAPLVSDNREHTAGRQSTGDDRFCCVARTLSMFMLACEWLGTKPVVHIIHPLTNTNMLSAATCGIECGRKSMSHSLSSEKARLEEHQREARIHELLQSYKKVV
jgi:hypothetical protein